MLFLVTFYISIAACPLLFRVDKSLPCPLIFLLEVSIALQLCCTKHGRDFLREKQTYVILRELHKWEEDAEAKQTCENLVHILILDEPDSGPENWDEIELKEAQT